MLSHAAPDPLGHLHAPVSLLKLMRKRGELFAQYVPGARAAAKHSFAEAKTPLPDASITDEAPPLHMPSASWTQTSGTAGGGAGGGAAGGSGDEGGDGGTLSRRQMHE